MALITHEGNSETGIVVREMTEEEESVHMAEQVRAQEQGAAWRSGREAAARRRADDLALLASSDDPHHQALARLLGGG